MREGYEESRGPAVPEHILAREIELLRNRLRELEGAMRTEQSGDLDQDFRDVSAMYWLFNHIEDYITAIGPDFRIISYNQAMENKFGKNLYGRLCYETYHDRDSVCPGCAAEKAIASGRPEATFQTATDATGPVEIRAYPVFGEDGEIIAVIEHGRDVTEKLELLSKVEDNERFLKTLIDGVSEPIMVIGRDHTIKLMNKAAYERVPVSRRGEFGLKCYEISHKRESPCSGPEDSCPLEIVKNSMKSEVVEHIHFRADGTCEFIEISASPLLDENGELVGIIEANRDITERKRSEIALREAEEKYSALWNSEMVGIAVADEKGKYIDANSTMLQMLGCSEKELIGKKFRDVSHPDDIEDNDYNFKKLVAGRKTTYRLRKRYIHKDGHIVWCDLSVFGIYGHGGVFQYCYGIHRDITKEIVAEDNLRWELDVSRALGEVGSTMLKKDVSIEELAGLVHSFSMKLTGSTHGFVSIVDPDDLSSIVYSFTKMMDRACLSGEKERKMRFPRGDDGRYPGLWGHALNTGEGFFTNSPREHPYACGLPEGHIEIESFMAMPATVGSEMLGLIALANRPGGFSERDLEAVRRMAELYAISILNTRSEQRLQASLREKDVLLREIHHRVKNNMQIISSLLHLQEKSIKVSKLGPVFEESQNRIRSMALVHEKLYQNDDISHISLRDYVDSLAKHLLSSYLKPDRPISIELQVEDIEICIDDLIPLGLVLNELISNSMKHAFAERDAGRMSVLIREYPAGTINVSVEDDGRGMPPDFELFGDEAIGLKLVNTLAKQLGTDLEIEESDGLRFSLSFRRTDA